MSTTADLLAARPQLRPDVVLGAAQQRGPARVHLVRLLADDRSMEIGAKEYFVLARLDGTRSLAQIGEEYTSEFGTVLAQANWGQILGTLHRRGLLSGTGAAARPGPVVRPPDRGLGTAVPLVREPSTLLDSVLRWSRVAFTPWLAVPVLAAVALMVTVVVGRVGELADQAAPVLHHPGALLLVGALTWVTTALHELAHGVAARRYGVPVLEIGIRWLPPLLMPYCRTDGYLYLPRRRSHVTIAAAGIVVELALLLPVFAVWWWWTPSGRSLELVAALLLCGTAHALVNVLPVPPLDGYKALSHALGLTDYAQHSLGFVRLAARREPQARAYPRWVRAAYVAYAAVLGLVVAAAVAGMVALLLVAGHAWVDSWGRAVALLAAVLVALLAVAACASVLVRRRRRRGRRPRPLASQPGRRVRGGAEQTAPRYRPKHARSRPALELDGVVKSYGGRRAVDGVTLTVESGEFVGLLGPNGAGKTTLVEIAVGLRRADRGQVAVLGEPMGPRSPALLARIGLQTQTAAFFVRLTAREHLRTVAALYGVGREAADDALRLVGLEDVADTRAERLSGGQQQRLAIATALVHDPDLVFLDEPTASLDPQARRELWSVLRSLHAAGRTVVYTTHHLDEAEALCDRVAIMASGSVVALGAPHELIEDAALPTRLVVPRTALTPEQACTLPGVASASLQGPSVVIETHDSPAVLEELDRIVGRYGVQTRPPTLEDVYLHCIGSEPVT